MATVDGSFDLVLRGGRVIDPAQGIDARLDVGIVGGRVAALAPGLGPAAQELDVHGMLVLPGLIDLHAHVFSGIGPSADADRDALAHGATTVVDAGSAGYLTLPGFRRYVAERATARVLSFINLSSIGLLDVRIGELQNRTYLDERATVEAIRANRNLVRGVKVRLSEYVVGGFSRLALESALRVAQQAGVPIMAHIGDTSEPLAELLPLFRRGDIVTHTFTGRRHGLLGRDGRVLEAAREARARGVHFDGAAGRSHFNADVAARLIEQDFLPDSLATDVTAPSAPHLNLPILMSRLLSLGVALVDVVRMVTAGPARALGEPGWGTLGPESEADVAVLEPLEQPWTYVDADGFEREAQDQLRSRLTLRVGRVVQPA